MFFGGVTDFRGTAESDVEVGHFSDRSALDDGGHVVTVVLPDPLTAGCADPVVFSCGGDDVTTFGEGQGQGFLTVDVFSCAAGFDCYLRVPVVGGRIDDYVDFFICEDVFVFRVYLAVFVAVHVVDLIAAAVGVGGVTVADADDSRCVLVMPEIADDFVSTVPDPDEDDR